MSAEELAAMDAKIVADTIAEMQRQIEQLTGARHSMYDPAVAIARDIALRTLRFELNRLDLADMTVKPHTIKIVGPAPTPPAMSAVHIGDAGKMAHVLRGMVNRGTLIDAEAIDRALTLAVYRQDPDDDDRAWAASQAEVIGQPVVPVGSGDADNEAAPVKAVACQTCKGAHPELCSNVFHISHPAPIKPSGDTEKLRDDVLERLRVLDFAGHYDEARFQYIADTILDLIQSEKAG